MLADHNFSLWLLYLYAHLTSVSPAAVPTYDTISNICDLKRTKFRTGDIDILMTAALRIEIIRTTLSQHSPIPQQFQVLTNGTALANAVLVPGANGGWRAVCSSARSCQLWKVKRRVGFLSRIRKKCVFLATRDGVLG